MRGASPARSPQERVNRRIAVRRVSSLSLVGCVRFISAAGELLCSLIAWERELLSRVRGTTPCLEYSLRSPTVVARLLGHLIMERKPMPRHAKDDLHGALSVLRHCGSQRVHDVLNLSEVSRRPWSDLSTRPRNGRRPSVTLWLTRTTDVGIRALCSRFGSIQGDRSRLWGRTHPFSGVHTNPHVSASSRALGLTTCGSHRFDTPPPKGCAESSSNAFRRSRRGGRMRRSWSPSLCHMSCLSTRPGNVHPSRLWLQRHWGAKRNWAA